MMRISIKVWQEIMSWVKTFIIVFAIVTLVQKFVLTPVKVDGMSMYPTFYNGDGALLWMLDYEPELFDIIVFRQSPDNYYIKRIVGLPGQHVEYQQGRLYIDRERIDEPYINKDFFVSNFTLEGVCQFEDCEVIPEGYYFVLGDNRHRSEDSREIGLISENQILGRVIWQHWPLSNFGRIEKLAD